MERGEVAALLGPTGSGKTTLLLILAGLLKPEAGEVLLDGVPLDGENPEHRRMLGVVFQDPDSQLFNPTVYDEIAYALRTLGLPEDEVRARVRGVAERLGIGGLLERPPYELSMGQKRLVAIASVLVYEPRYLLLDEPLTFLDPSTALRVACIVRSVSEVGVGVLMATHNVEAALLLADRLYRVVEGRIVGVEAEELLGEPRSLLAVNPALAALASRGEALEAIREARGMLQGACSR